MTESRENQGWHTSARQPIRRRASRSAHRFAETRTWDGSDYNAWASSSRASPQGMSWRGAKPRWIDFSDCDKGNNYQNARTVELSARVICMGHLACFMGIRYLSHGKTEHLSPERLAGGMIGDRSPLVPICCSSRVTARRNRPGFCRYMWLPTASAAWALL